ncbi:uncharacterized protein YjiS (DUF1127 family) [Rhizobium sp. SG_E_25_P2]|nr:DUF1127 domain-containing protein [Rhizobium sp. SG_E_25_P2]MDH6269761.1 uncharacterized protein YjiS (DUF1127 family) [Rhizobium sp. SG_E_25_P2]
MNIMKRLNDWRKYRQTLSELGRISERELQDLGLRRADIEAVARGEIRR